MKKVYTVSVGRWRYIVMVYAWNYVRTTRRFWCPHWAWPVVRVLGIWWCYRYV